MNTHAKNFQRNSNYLLKTDSQLAYKLMRTDPSDLQFCHTQVNEANLRRVYQGTTYYYHTQEGACEEANTWFAGLELKGIHTLFVYGVGLGYYYQAAKSWLKNKKERALVFLEEDLGVIHRLMETDLGGKLIRDSQVQLIYFQDLEENKTLFNELSWTYVDSPFALSSLRMYAEVNPEGYQALQHELSFNLVEKKVFAEEYLHYGVVFFRNFYPNLLELPHAYSGNGLFEQFKDVPAIICGAGPSLNKNAELLNKYKDQALLLAGSSSLAALIPRGIIPHFGAAIDPNQGQQPRVEGTHGHQLPFFYRNRLFHSALTAVEGPKLFLTGAGGYDIADWFEAELGIDGHALDEGHNIVNFCIEIAYALGCNPIVLVGVDLAYTDQQPYAAGVVENLNLIPEVLIPQGGFEAEMVVRDDIYGKPVKTLWKWITESEWISDFAAKHPEVQLINATEGGLGFKDVPNLKLKEVAQEHFKVNLGLQNRVEHQIKQQRFSQISLEQVTKVIRKLQASLDQSIRLFEQIIGETRKLQDKIVKGEPYPQNLETAHISLLEHDLQEEVAYQFVLETFNQVYIRYHFRTIQQLQSPKRRLAQSKRDTLKLELQVRRLTFLKDVARVNRELIERTLRERDLRDLRDLRDDP